MTFRTARRSGFDGCALPTDASTIVVRLLCLLMAVTVSVGAHPVAGFAASGDRIEGLTPKKYGVPAAALPDVSMKSGVLVTEDGRVLWSRKPDTTRAMASITKVMSAIVAMENADLDDEVVITPAAGQVGYASMLLPAGAKLPLSELLGLLLVKSGNDAAIAVAAHVAGNEADFVKLMNAKADELGLSDTRFANSHGLDQKGHHSSAADVAVLVRYAMSKPEFRRIVSKQRLKLRHLPGKATIENTNLLIGRFDGANGVKTGWTDDAGYCVASSAKRDDLELYAVVLGTGSEAQRFTDARELLDWGFAHFREQRLASAGTVVGAASVTDYLDVTVPAEMSRDTTLPVFDLAGPIERSVTVSPVQAPVARGDRLGVATFTQRGHVVATVPLLATQDVEKPGLVERVAISVVRLWRRLTGASSQAALNHTQSAVSYRGLGSATG